MDISGVDVDFLNDEEIIELCSDIGDFNNDEISVLKEIDVNNLSDDKVNELYNDFLDEQNTQSKKLFMTDKQVLDNNFNIIDMKNDEIVLINNGYNINIDNLSENEILSLYSDILYDNKIFIADSSAYKLEGYSCYLGYKDNTPFIFCTDNTYGNTFGINGTDDAQRQGFIDNMGGEYVYSYGYSFGWYNVLTGLTSPYELTGLQIYDILPYCTGSLTQGTSNTYCNAFCSLTMPEGSYITYLSFYFSGNNQYCIK